MQKFDKPGVKPSLVNLLIGLLALYLSTPTVMLAQSAGTDTQNPLTAAVQVYLPLVANSTQTNGLDPNASDPNRHDDIYLAALARARNEPVFVAPDLSASAPTDRWGIGEWGPVMPWPFAFASAANLPDGRILAWGGNNRLDFTGGTSTYAAIWDPATGHFQSVNHTTHSMFCGIPTLLEDGRVLVNGGDGTRKRASTFDYRTEQWQRVDDMKAARWYPGSVALPSGQVFTALGDPGSPYPEIWTPGKGWSLLTGASLQAPILDFPGHQKNWLPYLHLAPSGSIFHSGPTQQMNWVDPTGTGAVAATGLTNGWFPKYSTVVMIDEGKLLMVGGASTNVSGAPSTNQAALIDLTGPTPTRQALAPMTYARKFNNGVILPNGEVMIIGGTTTGYEFSDWGTILTPEIWNPTTGIWRKVANIAIPRNYHSVALLMTDGRVWTGGGGLCDCNADHPDAQIYAPPYLFNPDGSPATRPVITDAPAVVTYGRTITVHTSPDVQHFSLIKLSSVTHDLNSDLRRLSVPFTESANGEYQLTLHSNRNVLTPGYWMLFALNSAGTPSIAKVIQVTSGRPFLQIIDALGNFVNERVDLQISASDPENDPLTFVATGLPPGLVLDPITGVASGVATTVGSYPVMITVSDGLTSVTERFAWLINQPERYRYVKLVAFSEGNGNPWSAAAEINLLDNQGEFLPRNGWQISADSEERVVHDGRAINAIDGNVTTAWQSAQNGDKLTHPHWLQIDLGADYHLSELRYLPRQGDLITGTIADYQLYVSPDNVHWGAIATGNFANDQSEKTISLVGRVPEFNIALNGVVSQSSTQADGDAGHAIDGNRDGVFSHHSVAATNPEANAWWEIDLGQPYLLRSIRLWNRTDCCADGLANVHVLVSGAPFVTQTLVATQNQPGISDLYLPGPLDTQTEIPLPRIGRYIRVQLANAHALHLAEVEVLANIIATLPAPLDLASLTSTPQPINTVVTYRAKPTGGANPQVKWLFDDDTPETNYASILTTTHTYTQPGRYIVTLTAVDDRGEEVRTSFVQAIHHPLTANRPVASTNLLYVERSADNGQIWVVNPDNDTVSIFDDVTHHKVAEVGVGQSPRTLALAPDGRVWVANQGTATISILDPTTFTVGQTLALPYAAQPFGIVFSPTGDHAYVTLTARDELRRLDPLTGAPTGVVAIGSHVRHLSINSDGSRLYLSRFITPPLPGEATATPQAVVNGMAVGGEILVVDGRTLTVVKTIVLQASDQPDTEHTGRGIPNYLGPAVIAPDGLTAWVASKQDNIFRGSGRDGRNLTFDSTVRSISSRLDLVNSVESYAARLDHDNGGIAVTSVFDHFGNYLFVALEGSRAVAVIDAYAGHELTRIAVGRAPQGLALSPDNRLLYVHNFMDRTVSVHDLTQFLASGEEVIPTVATYPTVAHELLSPQILLGKQLFYDAQDPRLARDGYLSCAACHHEGGQDGRVWDLTGFGEGLRNTIDLTGHGGIGQGPLHWSANFDEVQDFEGQIRALSSGTGLMNDADFAATRDPLGVPKAGHSIELDALAAYVASLNQFVQSPYRTGADALTAAGAAGKILFRTQQCAQCHGGASYTDSAANHLHDIATIKPTSGQRLGAPLLGLDTPTLRDLWATAPYLHDGSAPTLAAAVRAHGGAVTGGVLLAEDDLRDLVAYLTQIDDTERAPAYPNQSPPLKQVNDQTGTVGQSVTLVIGSNEPVDGSLRYQAYGLPPGLTLDSSRGTISGTLSAAGSYSVSISVSDGVTASGRFFTWVVEGVEE